MAEIQPTVTELRGFSDYVTRIQWTNVTNADTFAAAPVGAAALRSVQIEGTFGSATVVIQGSLDGTNYQTLTDLQGSAISKTTTALEGIAEFTAFIKPSASGGGGTQSVTVTLILKRMS